MMDVKHRIKELHERSRAERARINGLSARLGDLKQLLQPAISQLDFVDHLFLDPKILSEERTPHQWNYWLGGATAALKIATDTREYVEAQAKKYGDDARLFEV